jgi:predicted exporter
MRRKQIVLAAWLALLVLGGLIAARTSYRTDMGDFLPRAGSPAQRLLAGQVNGGAASHILLLSLTGAPAPVLANLSTNLAAQLRHDPAFLDVLNGGADSFAGAQNYLWKNRYLLVPTDFSAPGLRAALQADLAQLSSPLGLAVGQGLSADPTNAMQSLLGHMSAPGPAMVNGVWMKPDGSAALLLVHTTAPGFNLDAQQQAQAHIIAAFAQVKTGMAGGAILQMSGPGVFAVQSRDTTKQDVSRLSALALLGAASLLLFAYRSPLMLLLGLLPILSGALAGIAAVSLVFGFVHGITLGFGVTLIGESLDYAIYLFTQTRQGEGGAATLSRIWPTLRLGALTSCAGFAAMLASSFTGFAQLGLFSIAGLVGAAATTRFVLPHLMPAGFFAFGAAPLARPVFLLLRHRHFARVIIAAAALASIAALALHRGPMWDSNLLDLSPIPATQQRLDSDLHAALGLHGERYFALLPAASEQQALARSEALAPQLDALVAAQKLGTYTLPSTLLPSDRTQRERRASLPDTTTLHANFAQAAAGLPFNVSAFSSFFADAEATRTAPLLTPESLPPALALQVSSLLTPEGANWMVMAPLTNVSDPVTLARHLAASGADFADLDQESTKLLKNFQSQAVTLAVAGSLAILLLLLIFLRSWRRVLAVAVPLAAAVLITAALLTLGGAKLSIFMVAGFLLIIAIGSNYGLFFARTRPGTPDWPRAAASIVLANLCTVAAYGLLSLSRIPVLHDIGLTVAVGTFLVLLCSAVLSTPEAA